MSASVIVFARLSVWPISRSSKKIPLIASIPLVNVSERSAGCAPANQPGRGVDKAVDPAQTAKNGASAGRENKTSGLVQPREVVDDKARSEEGRIVDDGSTHQRETVYEDGNDSYLLIGGMMGEN